MYRLLMEVGIVNALIAEKTYTSIYGTLKTSYQYLTDMTIMVLTVSNYIEMLTINVLIVERAFM